jgi:hypothetical protein
VVQGQPIVYLGCFFITSGSLKYVQEPRTIGESPVKNITGKPVTIFKAVTNLIVNGAFENRARETELFLLFIQFLWSTLVIARQTTGASATIKRSADFTGYATGSYSHF